MNTISVFIEDNVFKEATGVVGTINDAVYLMKKKKYADFTIVFRDRRDMVVYKKELDRFRIPYSDSDAGFFLDQSAVREALKICMFYIRPYDEDAFRLMMKKFGRIEQEKIEELLMQSRVSGEKPGVLLHRYVDLLPPSGTKAEGQLLIRALEREYNSFEECLEILNFCNFWRTLRANREDEDDEKIYYLDQFCERVKTYDRVCDAKPVAERILSFEQYHRDQWEVIRKDTVSLMQLKEYFETEHDYVFIAGAVEGVYPRMEKGEGESETAIISEETIESERKLFRAILSKANGNAAIAFHESEEREGYRIPCERSRFINEIPRDRIRYVY